MTNDISRERFRWEQPSQRLHHRSSAPLNIIIEGHLYRVVDWSLGGFKVFNFHHVMEEPGTQLPVAVTVPFRGFEINFDVMAEIVRCDDSGEMAARFVDMKDEHQELLRYFIQCLMTSEMVPVGDVIRRVDVPITPASEMPDVNPTMRLPIYRRRVGSIFKGAAYVLVGGFLFTYLLVTLYSHFFRLQVESAVVSAPVEAVQTPIAGHFTQLYVEAGEEIRKDQPLLKIANGGINEALKLAQIEVGDARAELREQEDLLQAQQEQLSIYKQIGESRLQAAQASDDAAREKLRLSNAKLKRFQALHLKNLISATVLEQAEDDHNLAREGIKVAEAELAVAKNSLKAISSGRFFTGEKLEGNVPEFEAAVTAARKRLDLAEQKLAAAKSRDNELLIPAPFDGRVVKVLKSLSNTVDRGEPLVLLERQDNRVIDVYLTQEEVTQIGLDSPAVGYIPAVQKRAELRVLSIDRTTGFLDQVQSRFYWRGSQDRSAHVQLRFEGLTPEQIRSDFPAGLPVIVNFQRESANQLLISSKQYASDLWASTMTTANDWLQTGLAWFNSKPAIAASSVSSDDEQALGMTLSLTDLRSDKNNESYCATKLWPEANKHLLDFSKIPDDLLKQFFKRANKAVISLPAPQPTLHSAGINDPKDPQLLLSRRAFRDADNAAILALAYRLSGQAIYKTHAKRILSAWANTYRPNGHPIDETRLDGLLWAYDFLHCDFNATENQQIRSWLLDMREKKRDWQFGSVSQHNNHRTHQLKMLFLLNKLLDDRNGWQEDTADAIKHAEINIKNDGATIDYQERDALYYHVYDLEAWTEIALLNDCCQSSVTRAFGFLQQRLTTDDIHDEFANTNSETDKQRSMAGFDYAEKGGSYDILNAIPAILSYNTKNINTKPLLMEIIRDSGQDELEQHLFKLVRYHLWQSNS